MKVEAALEEHDSDLGELVRSLKKIEDNHCEEVLKALRTLDTTYRDLPAKALALTFEHFAWSGPALLGVEVLISQPAPGDLDALVETLAEFFVQHRHILRAHKLEDDCDEQTP